MSVANFHELAEHVGHNIVCVTYGGTWPPQRGQAPAANVAIECEDCSEVLLDFDREEDE